MEQKEIDDMIHDADILGTKVVKYNETIDIGWIKELYESIAACFCFNFDDSSQQHSLLMDALDKRCNWICSNCGNYNFVKLIAKKVENDVSVCSLCGIKQIDSIVLQMKGYDTYIMVNDVMDHKDINEMQMDGIDTMIHDALTVNDAFDLRCLMMNNHSKCPHILRLAKYLIKYKRWLHTIYQKKGDDSAESTIKVDIAKYVNNEMYRHIFMQSLESTKELKKHQRKSLSDIFDKNQGDIQNIQTFLKMEKKYQFRAVFIKPKKLSIATRCYARIWKRIWAKLKRHAQTQEFGEFLSDVDADILSKDYHHILYFHIKKGSKITKEHVFNFFGFMVHYEDNETMKAECRSMHRYEQRVDADEKKAYNQSNIEYETKHNDDMFNKEDKDIWTKKQQYIQSQLDIIHYYLVHSDTKRQSSSSQKQSKFVTTLSEEGTTHYMFGIAHSYPHLTPLQFPCIRDELLYNTLQSLTFNGFEMLLVKSIKKYKESISSVHKNDRICKYFDKEYMIIRNELIGVRHILSIIAYTDNTCFCTAFRSTYRRIKDEEKDHEAVMRHQQLYHYARALFEAIEFFGDEMTDRMTVYHGLNKKMHFAQFTAYFNQPISTTTSRTVAGQFATECGIVLHLKSGASGHKVPKFLSVSWISSYPSESELLFHGDHVVFNIYDIVAELTKSHKSDLTLLNKFQRMVQGGKVSWNRKKDTVSKTVVALNNLITQYIDKQMDKMNEEYFTKYGAQLFEYFCSNINTTSITIRRYTSLPKQFQRTLFRKDRVFSLNPVLDLFEKMTHLSLNELNIYEMTMTSEHYIKAVLHCCQHVRDREHPLKEIKFQSEAQPNRKENSTLKTMVSQYSDKFSRFSWHITYKFEETSILTHNLIFTNHGFKLMQRTQIKKQRENSGMQENTEQLLIDIEKFKQQNKLLLLELETVVEKNKTLTQKVQKTRAFEEFFQYDRNEDLFTLHTQCEELKSQVQRNKQRIDTLTQENDVLQKENEHYKVTVDKLETETISLKDTLEQKSIEIQRLKTVEDNEYYTQQLLEDIEGLQQENRNLKMELETYMDEVQNFQNNNKESISNRRATTLHIPLSNDEKESLIEIYEQNKELSPKTTAPSIPSADEDENLFELQRGYEYAETMDQWMDGDSGSDDEAWLKDTTLQQPITMDLNEFPNKYTEQEFVETIFDE